MLPYNTLDTLDVSAKRTLVRVDFNVPLGEKGEIESALRIKAHLKTIKELVSKGAKVILLSHIDNNGGSIQITQKTLAELLGMDVKFAKDCIGETALEAVNNLQNGEVLLLENTRKHKGEKENSEEMSKALAELCDVYINDAFPAAHRAHASTTGVAKFAKETGIGRLMESELTTLGELMKAPKKPLVVIVGGAKVSTKIGALKELMNIADSILIGGAMANTFLKATGKDIGNSLCEADYLDIAQATLTEAGVRGCNIILPRDVIVAESLNENAPHENLPITRVPAGGYIVDIGEETLQVWEKEIQNAGTILWNGPVGAFETKPFDAGTNELAEILGKAGGFTIVGGGDTLSALEHYDDVLSKINQVSTAGGALLDFIEGHPLPALEALKK